MASCSPSWGLCAAPKPLRPRRRGRRADAPRSFLARVVSESVWPPPPRCQDQRGVDLSPHQMLCSGGRGRAWRSQQDERSSADRHRVCGPGRGRTRGWCQSVAGQRGTCSHGCRGLTGSGAASAPWCGSWQGRTVVLRASRAEVSVAGSGARVTWRCGQVRSGPVMSGAKSRPMPMMRCHSASAASPRACLQRRSRRWASVDHGGCGFDFHELVVVSECGNTDQRARDVMVTECVADDLPCRHEISLVGRGDEYTGGNDVL